MKHFSDKIILSGHRGERVEYKDKSSCAVLHFDESDNPLGNNFGQDNSSGKKYCYTLVHMCGLRPFDVKNFDTDGLTGYGGLKAKQYYPHTGTPLFAQYLVFEVFKDRAVFYVRNAGKKPGFAIDDKLAPYTVFFRR